VRSAVKRHRKEGTGKTHWKKSHWRKGMPIGKKGTNMTVSLEFKINLKIISHQILL
jgi:hypothetical protein